MSSRDRDACYLRVPLGEMTLEQCEKSISWYESVLKRAASGEFDDAWKNAPPIEGRDQREMFVTSCENRLRLFRARRAELLQK